MEKFENKAELSDKELEQIIFLSFMFSQGSGMLQDKILRALSFYCGPQEEAQIKRAFEAITSKLNSDGKEFLLSKANIHAGGRRVTLGINEQQEYLESLERDIQLEPDLRNIVAGIWSKDFEYLCETEGRPNRKDSFKPDSIQDPFFSFGIHYLLRENDTSNRQFNLLLEKLRDVIGIKDSAKLSVIEKYNETHPDNKFLE